MSRVEPRVTIVVVPRERFSESKRSLESVYEHTQMPFKLVYVDGRSPRKIRLYLEESAPKRGFQHVRLNRYLSPNEARNIGLRHVDTEYVVFLDNDLIASPGWLDRLVECADETGAWLVGPLYLEGDPKDEIIHMAGGDIEFDGEPGKRTFTTDHRFQGTAVADLPEPLKREPCDFIEFHCMLARSDVFEKLGPLDEKLMSTREHLDLCLKTREAGGEVYFEPTSVVTYSTPPPLAVSDIPFFMVRWSEAWGRTSLERFVEKYELDPSYADRVRIMTGRRQIVFRPIRRAVRKIAGGTADYYAGEALLRAERTVNRVLVKTPSS
jgi:GT2 family glycosyltransferase